MKKYITNLIQYRKWIKTKNKYQHIKDSIIQYKVIGFNCLTGKVIFTYNNFGLFGVTEMDIDKFI